MRAAYPLLIPMPSPGPLGPATAGWSAATATGGSVLSADGRNRSTRDPRGLPFAPGGGAGGQSVGCARVGHHAIAPADCRPDARSQSPDPPARRRRLPALAFGAAVRDRARRAGVGELPPTVDVVSLYLRAPRLVVADGPPPPSPSSSPVRRWRTFHAGSSPSRPRCARWWSWASPAHWPLRRGAGSSTPCPRWSLVDVSDSVSVRGTRGRARGRSPNLERAAAHRGQPAPRVVRFAATRRRDRAGVTGHVPARQPDRRRHALDSIRGARHWGQHRYRHGHRARRRVDRRDGVATPTAGLRRASDARRFGGGG